MGAGRRRLRRQPPGVDPSRTAAPPELPHQVCHGSAGLRSAVPSDGTWAFAGRELTAFTDEEEVQAGLANQAPWLLEDRLRAAGARSMAGTAWAPFVVVDGDLVTGQNPASSAEAARRVVDRLRDKAALPA